MPRTIYIGLIIESCQKRVFPISSETARRTAAKFCMPTRAKSCSSQELRGYELSHIPIHYADKALPETEHAA